MKDQLLGHLMDNFLFRSISGEELRELDVSCFRQVHFHKGDVIIHQDDTSNEIYLIVNGFVEIIKSIPGHKSEMLLQKGPGEFLGEVSMLLSAHRTATVTCITDVEALVVSPEGMRHVINTLPAVRKNILKNIVDIVFDEDQRVVTEIIEGNLLAEMFNAISISTRELERLNRQLKQANLELERKNKKLYEMATYDSLTKIYNRAFVMDMFSKEFSKSQRHGLDLACLIIDVDSFKHVNDVYGHLTGDVVLKQIAYNMQDALREQDILGRYGGEEFLVVLPNASLEGAATVAEKLRHRIEHSLQGFIEDLDLVVTISIGVTDNKLERPKKVDDMLFCADTALYAAKSQGKNRVVVFRQTMHKEP